MFISEQYNGVSSAQCQNLHNIGVTMGKKKKKLSVHGKSDEYHKNSVIYCCGKLINVNRILLIV